MSREGKRYAFVPPRYGKDIGGGAETLVAALAGKLAARGDEIEIWTTCARDNRTWENSFEAGETDENGLRIIRFPVSPRSLDVWVPLQIRISEGLRLDPEEQLKWMEHSVNSETLYQHIHDNADRFDAIFFAPYLFGTTFHGSLVRPDKSLLIPCLHNESYAYLETIASMFRLTRGCLFNACAEMDLARSLYGREIKGGEVGMGFDPVLAEEAESLQPFFTDSFPYLLYVGRKETGKGVQVLIDNFIVLKESGLCPEMKLVICGGGSFSDLHRPNALDRNDIVDISHVSEREKRQLIRHARCLCQPSTNESFSIVIMEAWLLNTPVLVNAACPVTRDHVVASGGGLYFRDTEDFCGTINEISGNPELRMELARAGAQYVNSFYSWDAVLGRFDKVMGSFEVSPSASDFA